MAFITLVTRSIRPGGRNRRRADESQERNVDVFGGQGRDPAGLTQAPQTDSPRVDVRALTKGGDRGANIPGQIAQRGPPVSRRFPDASLVVDEARDAVRRQEIRNQSKVADGTIPRLIPRTVDHDNCGMRTPGAWPHHLAGQRHVTEVKLTSCVS